MFHMDMIETITLDAADIKMTSDGYMAVMPRIARTGIQIYNGDELGRPDLKQVRVYRPESEVFKEDSLRSFAYKPVTNDHPNEAVTSKNWKKYAVGQLGGDVVRDGEFIRLPMVLMDATTIDDVKSGKAQLSAGYGANLVWGDGVSPSGEQYDAMQTDIRANHVAVCNVARGGSKLKIGDAPDDSRNGKQTEKAMTTKTILVDGISVTVPEMEANIVQRHIQTLNDSVAKIKIDLDAANQQVAKVTTDAATAATEAKKLADTQAAEIATLKKQLEDAAMSPMKLDALVNDRMVVVTKARAVIGDKLEVAGKTINEVMSQVVTAKIGDAAKDWNADMVKASFDTLTAGVDLSKATQTNDGVTLLAQNIADVKKGDYTVVDQGYTNYDKKLSDAWKGAAAN